MVSVGLDRPRIAATERPDIGEVHAASMGGAHHSQNQNNDCYGYQKGPS